jgi:hypothetical protein
VSADLGISEETSTFYRWRLHSLFQMPGSSQDLRSILSGPRLLGIDTLRHLGL